MDDGGDDAGVCEDAERSGSERGVWSEVGEMNFAPHSRQYSRQNHFFDYQFHDLKNLLMASRVRVDAVVDILNSEVRCEIDKNQMVLRTMFLDSIVIFYGFDRYKSILVIKRMSDFLVDGSQTNKDNFIGVFLS